jgi:hypothetical protein
MSLGESAGVVNLREHLYSSMDYITGKSAFPFVLTRQVPFCSVPPISGEINHRSHPALILSMIRVQWLKSIARATLVRPRGINLYRLWMPDGEILNVVREIYCSAITVQLLPVN